MRTILAYLLLILFSLPCLATRVSLFPLSMEHRYLENENQDLYAQRMDTSFSAALTFSRYQLGLDVTGWSQQSTTPLISFKETFSEIGSTHLFLVSSFYEYVHLYSGLGLGIYESKLSNQFAGATSETNTGQILFASAIASAQIIYHYFHAAVDFKLLMAKDYRPQPTPSAVIKLGLSF